VGKRRTFTAEFKQEAVQLAKQPDVALSQVARDLELSESLLRRWVHASDQKGEAAFPGKGKPGLNAEQAEIQSLKRELDIARQERDILKKAVACLGQNSTRMGLARFFAKESR
jgi:transposase